MKLIAGLGNPGKKYAGTRHNIGFDLLDELARRYGASPAKVKFEAELAEIQVGSERVLLLAPQTYMNLSGWSVRKASDFFQLNADQVLVVCDDINLPLGKIRLRRSGTAGGQKGLENVVQQLGTEHVPRLRIGVDAPPPQMDSAAYVLGRFAKQELPEVERSLLLAADAAEVWVKSGIEAAMNQFNAAGGKPGLAAE